METYSSSNAVAQDPEERVKLNKPKSNTTIYLTYKKDKTASEAKDWPRTTHKHLNYAVRIKDYICANEPVAASLNKEGYKPKYKK